MPRGRTPENGESRDKVFSLRLNPSEVRDLDKVRGDVGRSTYMRNVVVKAIKK